MCSVAHCKSCVSIPVGRVPIRLSEHQFRCLDRNHRLTSLQHRSVRFGPAHQCWYGCKRLVRAYRRYVVVRHQLVVLHVLTSEDQCLHEQYVSVADRMRFCYMNTADFRYCQHNTHQVLPASYAGRVADAVWFVGTGNATCDQGLLDPSYRPVSRCGHSVAAPATKENLRVSGQQVTQLPNFINMNYAKPACPAHHVVHVLPRRHGGDALEWVIHCSNLLKHLRLHRTS